MEEEAKIDSKRIEKAVDAIFDLKSVTYDSDGAFNNAILSILSDFEDKYKISKALLHYIALVGVFPPEYNIVRNWNKHETIFVELVK